MSGSIIKYLGDQPLMTVLGGLLASSRPRHLRDLASQYSLSPAGVSDILKRLNSVGILKSVRQKNRKCYSLDLIEQERDCLKTFFSIYQKVRLEERAILFSCNAADKLKRMDEAYVFYRGVKKKRR